MSQWTMVARDVQGRLLATLRPGTTKEVWPEAELNWRGIATDAGIISYLDVTFDSFLLPRVLVYNPSAVLSGETVFGSVQITNLPKSKLEKVRCEKLEVFPRKCTCGTQGTGICSDWCDLVRTNP
jgi:hypothetical protein